MEFMLWLVFCLLSGAACFGLFDKSVDWFEKI